MDKDKVKARKMGDERKDKTRNDKKWTRTR
jgi:hypothetical protein